MPAKTLHYLTVQDVLWVNLQVTGLIVPFRYAVLEEVTFNQYGYGPETDLLTRAGALLTGFLNKKPFDEGNEETAVIATFAFLEANHREVFLPAEGVASWISAFSTDTGANQAAIASVSRVREAEYHPHEEKVKDILLGLLARYPPTSLSRSRPREVCND